MTDAERDACLISAMLRHLNNQRLPKLLAMKERLNCGERADQEDMRYISRTSPNEPCRTRRRPIDRADVLAHWRHRGFPATFRSLSSNPFR